MNKVQKLIQCIVTRRLILGKIGKNNEFRPKVLITSAATIGNYNHFGDRVMVGNARIGNFCSFAPDVKIGQSQHAIQYITTCQKICAHNIGYSMIKQPAVIGSDVWIGANAVIMQGVHVGNGAVIGANAVVTHDIPPYAVVVGVPARIIKYRFNEEQISLIDQSCWYDYKIDEAMKKVKELEKQIFCN